MRAVMFRHPRSVAATPRLVLNRLVEPYQQREE